MTQPRQPPHRPGYLLIELLVIIGILSIAIFVEIRLYRASVGVIYAEPQAQKNLIAIDQFTLRLRKDVWSATAISVNESRSVTLEYPDNRKVEWTFTESEVTRSDASAGPDMQRRSYSIPLHLVARAEGSRLVIATPADAKSQSEQIFTSQLMFNGGGQ